MPGEWALLITIDGNEVDASAVEFLQQREAYPGGHSYQVCTAGKAASFLASQLSEASGATSAWRTARRVFGALGIIRRRAGTPEAVLEWFLNTVDKVEVQPGRVVISGQASPVLNK
jgi:hypothetical protein